MSSKTFFTLALFAIIGSNALAKGTAPAHEILTVGKTIELTSNETAVDGPVKTEFFRGEEPGYFGLKYSCFLEVIAPKYTTPQILQGQTIGIMYSPIDIGAGSNRIILQGFDKAALFDVNTGKVIGYAECSADSVVRQALRNFLAPKDIAATLRKHTLGQ